MLRVTIDIFSGRPNPSWIVTSDVITERVISAVAENPALAGKIGRGFQTLGFRGVQVEIISDDHDAPKTVPRQFVLASEPGDSLRAGGALAESLIGEMTKSRKIILPDHTLTPLTAAIRNFALKCLAGVLKDPPRIFPWPKPRSALRRTVSDTSCDKCQYEISLFNPNFWNSDPAVLRSNNCYNFARDWRTNTFAQPGRASGHPTSNYLCPNVSAAAQSDGLVNRCKCLPHGEYPRRLMALVIAPHMDYHWYRQQMGGFWGHKPGQTPARNYDNNGVPVTNPETAARGIYTQFCGYFYAGKSVVIS